MLPGVPVLLCCLACARLRFSCMGPSPCQLHHIARAHSTFCCPYSDWQVGTWCDSLNFTSRMDIPGSMEVLLQTVCVSTYSSRSVSLAPDVFTPQPPDTSIVYRFFGHSLVPSTTGPATSQALFLFGITSQSPWFLVSPMLASSVTSNFI